MVVERLVTPGGTPVERRSPVRPRGGVVLISEVWGLTEGLRAYADRLVAEGWTVALPDLWWRTGVPAMDTPAGVSAAVASLSDSQALADVRAAVNLLPTGLPRFALGFCVGGLYARMAGSAMMGLAGVVEFYGRIVYPAISANKPVQPLDLLPGLQCPLQAHYGDRDPIAPPAHVDELERRLAARPSPAQVFRYPGCGHAFLNEGGPGWDPDAACTAWGRALTFLDQVAAASV